MSLERVSGSANVIDVLDRVLDKGIVIDAWVQLSFVGIDLLTIEAQVVVASIETYLNDTRVLPGNPERESLPQGSTPGATSARRVRRPPRR